MKILLHFNANVKTEDISKPTIRTRVYVELVKIIGF
jgi:hypothetical protein